MRHPNFKAPVHFFAIPCSSSLLTSSLSCSNSIKLILYNSLKVNQYSVTGTDGGKLEVFSLAEGRSLSSAPAHTNAVTALSVSEDEAQTLLVSGSEDGIIKVYQVQRYLIYLSVN